MKNTIKKAAAIVLAVTMLIGTEAVSVYADAATSEEEFSVIDSNDFMSSEPVVVEEVFQKDDTVSQGGQQEKQSLTATVLSEGAKGYTRAEAVEWIKRKAMQDAEDSDNCGGVQCVDLAHFYYEYLGCTFPYLGITEGAADLIYQDNAVPSGWTRYGNDADPLPGDVVVYAPGVANADPIYGHVALIDEVSETGYHVVEYNAGSSTPSDRTLSLHEFSALIRPGFEDGDIASGDGWKLDSSGCLHLTGNITVYENYGSGIPYYGTGTPWSSQRDNIQTVIAEKGSSINDGYCLFSFCRNLTYADLSNLDTSSVISMSSMFGGCGSLTELDVSGFDTSNTVSMASMFEDCGSLTELDVSGFDTDNVFEMERMFLGCENLTELDVSGFNTKKLTSMTYMFSGCQSLTELDVTSFDTGNVTDMTGMFSGCQSLTGLDVTDFDTRNVTGMAYMFSGCQGLTELDLSSFLTFKVTDMESMFESCSNLKDLKITGFDTRMVADMSHMFSWCQKLENLDLSGFDTGMVTDMACMFDRCESLISLDVSGFETISAIDMSYMFHYCSSLESIDVTGFITENCTDMQNMFSMCFELESLDLSSFNTKSIERKLADYDESTSIVYGCYRLSTIRLGEGWTGAEVLNMPSSQFIEGACDMWRSSSGIWYNPEDIPARTTDTYTAIAPDAFIVTFNMNGKGQKVSPQEVNNGAKIVKPSDPIADGYTFGGWYREASCTNAWNFNTDNVTCNLTLYAKWNGETPAFPVQKNIELSFKDGTKTRITWGSSLFDCSAVNYNRNLDLAALYLAEAAECGNVDEKMSQLGFTEISHNTRGINNPVTTVGYSTFNGTYGETGRKYLVCVTIQGTDPSEMADLITDINSLQDGFKNSGENIYDFVETYIETKIPAANTDNTVFFINGHSLGGAVSGELTYFLDEKYYKDQTFTYTYASPQFNRNGEASSKYQNIFNTVNNNDIVPAVPHGFSRLGVKRLYSTPDDFVKQYNKQQLDWQTGLIRSGILFGGNIGLAGIQTDWTLLINGNGFDLGSEHDTSTYLDLILNHSPIAVGFEDSAVIDYYAIHCPVDVKILDGNGNVIAESIEDKAYNYCPNDLLLFTQDDEKHIIKTGNREYVFEFTGTDSGEMSYSAAKFDNTADQALEKKEFMNVALEDGKKLTSRTEDNMESVALYVMGDDGDAVSEVQENGEETPLIVKYTVTFNSNGHGVSPQNQEITAGEKLAKPGDLTVAGYVFGGWYREASCINRWNFDIDEIDSNITLFAKWTAITAEDTFAVSFNANGHGTAPAKQTVAAGSKAAKPQDPSDSEYTFGGWFKEATCKNEFDFASVITKNIILYAKWTKKNSSNNSETVSGVTPSISGGTVSSYGGGVIASYGRDIIAGLRTPATSGLPSWVEKDGEWSKDSAGVWYYTNNGLLYRNRWGCIYNPFAPKGRRKYDWFFFDENGSLANGWLTDKDGNVYYLNPVHDGTFGAMIIGWYQNGGNWYYFSDAEGSGTMGAMLRNTTTPDGYKVGEDGSWIK